MLLTTIVSAAVLAFSDGGTKPPEIAWVTILGKIGEASEVSLVGAIVAAEKEHIKSLVVEINSEGGDLGSGFTMSKLLESTGMETYCVVDGEADSMAFYVLQSCKHRYMTKRSKLMVHEPRITLNRDIDRFGLERLLANLEAEVAAMNEHYAARMKLPVKFVKDQVCNKEWWMGWESALHFNAIDGVVDSTDAIEGLIKTKIK